LKKEKRRIQQGETISTEQILTQSGHRLLTVEIRCPFEAELPTGRGMKRIVRYYRSIFDAYRRYCLGRLQSEANRHYRQSEEKGEPFDPWEASLVYRITVNDGSLLSLHYDRVEKQGSGSRCELRFSDTWRIRNGKLLPLEELMKSSGKRMLTEQVLKTVPLIGEQHFFPRWQKLVKKHLNTRRYYIRDREIILYFQPGTIAPVEMGVQEFAVGELFQQSSADSVIPALQTK